MAGVTNVAFRTLCREQEIEKTGTVSGLYVCEMITARALVERNEKTLHMTTFAPDENPRSMQLYTTDPEYTYRAASRRSPARAAARPSPTSGASSATSSPPPSAPLKVQTFR